MYSFKPISGTNEELQLLLSWFKKKHVSERWDGAPQTLKDVQHKIREKIENPKVFPFIITLNETPIGYIQMYEAFEAGEGWWEDQPEGTWGMDLFIGDESLLGKGHGTAIVKLFEAHIFDTMNAKKIIIDPKPDNVRAIRAYEKAGFIRVGAITTPDGPALLMETYPS